MRLLLIPVLLAVHFNSSAFTIRDIQQLRMEPIADNMRYAAVDTLAVSKDRFAVHFADKVAYIRMPAFCQLPAQLRRTRKQELA